MSRWVAPIVWFGWAAMVACAATLVWQYGLRMPYADSWNLVDVATGHQRPTLAWFWSLHNEHRLPLPKLVYYLIGTATGFNFARMALVNVAVMASAAAIWIVAMRRLRGRTSLVDLFMPGVLLHFGHEVNLTWTFNFCLTTLLATSALLVIASATAPLHLGPAALLTLLGALLAGCGSAGLIYVPPLAAWLALAAFAAWRSRKVEPQPQAAAPWTLTAMSATLVAVFLAYALNFPHGTHNRELTSPSLWATVIGTLRFMVTSFGPVGRGAEPAGEVLMIVLLTGAATILWTRWRANDVPRTRLLGFGLFLTAGVLLAVSVAHSRAGGPADSLRQTRYAVHALPLLAALMLIWDRYASPRAHKFWATAVLVLLPVIVLVNDRKGLRDARDRAGSLSAIEAQLRASDATSAIALQWSGYLQCHPVALAVRLERLRASELGPYRVDADEPAGANVAAGETVRRR